MKKKLTLTSLLFFPVILFSQLILVEKWTLDPAEQEVETVDLIKTTYHLNPLEIISGSMREKMLDSVFTAIPKAGWTEYNENNEMSIKALCFPVYRLDTALAASDVPPYETTEVVVQSELKTYDIIKLNFYQIRKGEQMETVGISLFMVNRDIVYGEVVKNKPILRIKTFVKEVSYLPEILSFKGK